MKVSQSVLTVGVVGAFVSIAWSAQPLVPTAATQNCLDANPGLRAMTHGERLVGLYGVPFATDSDLNTTTDQFVANFLADPANAAAQTNESDVERLIQDLVSEDAKVADAAREQLRRMGHVVPVLFERLVEADWDLKPPLLEVLARVEGGRDYARLKLLHGTEAEKTYAALLYELIDLGEDTESCEYVAMVKVLLKALKSEDKNLRAAAGLALIYEESSAPVVFQHLHEIIPALVSNFDTDLVIDRRWRGDPSDMIFFGICYRVDALIGNRFAFQDFLSDPRNHSIRLESEDAFSLRRTVPKFLSANRLEINKLTTFWRNWWNKHSEMSVREIGIAIIERNLRVLEELDPSQWADHHVVAHGSLEVWTTGMYVLPPEDWASWWADYKANYTGPLPKGSQPRAHGPQVVEPRVGGKRLSSEVYEEIAQASGGISIRTHSPEEFGDGLDYILQEMTERLRNPDGRMETRRVKRPCPPSDVSPDWPEMFPSSLNLETLERLVQELVSEDAKTAREAGKQLHRMEHAVPVLFKSLVEADWDLKPSLLEVLAQVKGGRDYARLKLFHGTEAEKTYAALLYELIDQGEDTESCVHVAMVEVLLKALKSEDKNLRAAAGLALIDPEESTLFFEHLHKIIPALISSFDTDLVIHRRRREDPTDVVFIGICMRLETFIGDRLAYHEFILDPSNQSVSLRGKRGVALRHAMSEVISVNRQAIEKLRSSWQDWWDKHSQMSAVEIGKLIIERNLRVLSETEADRDRPEHPVIAQWSIQIWTGEYFELRTAKEWRSWWSDHKGTYNGPIQEAKE